ncbi:YhgE/Pip domain-containing protein [Dietzia sp. ANT_WB102]|uniref:YhgE/Pip domain-containing protein n=1 Tax=Dietzia sp. ANT_WB102 TaxID=2597345 RepID=UPI0011EDF093|nr:YhgE/Pip domain-containing protein [Dietzia sp. ANT_WB102]KAA0918328.1 YhgE/Pip domain-containing protein [Dietzia sp. ANT_WB102]
MRTVFSVFARDVRRLALVRKAWIVILGVMITPSLYAWVNITAFWDPYSRTENISVAVVNLDEGGSSTATGEVDVGSQLVDQLEKNDQLGWQFLDEDDAMEAVRSGTSYAAIIVPPDFTRDLLSITSGAFTPPSLTYYVNEKSNAVAPKITDVGASTLDTQVNSTFVSVVAKAVTEELSAAGDNVERRLLEARNGTVDALDGAVGSVASARERIRDVTAGLSRARSGLGSAGDTLDTVDATLGDVQTAVGQAREIADEAQQELATLTGSLTTTYVSGATLLADAASTLNGSVARGTSGLERANVAVRSGLDDADAIATKTGEALSEVQALLAAAAPDSALSGRLSEAVSALQDPVTGDQNVLARVRQLNADVAAATTAIRSSADAIDTAADAAGASARSVRDVLVQTGPDLNGAMSRLSASAGALSFAIDSQRTQLGQAQKLLTGLGDQLGETATALTALDGTLAGAESGLESVRTDVVALSTADAWDALGTLTGLDAEEIAQFMASPVEVDEHPVFPVAAYGDAMAPLFANLSLWIGAFVLVVIFKLEVDREGFTGLTTRQAYLGRWMLLAAMNVVQALILSIGTLVIGVEAASVLAFVATSVLIGLAYLSIIYALSVTFGYVGKGLCVLLIIMQIPGAAGLYPIELMPGFFRALYPFLPFTYGIDAMRETLSGFYGNHYWKNMAVLAVVVVLSFLLGLTLRKRLGNFALLFSRRLASTQLLVTEDVHITRRRYRLPQIIHALSNGGEYRRVVAARARRFTENYPILLRATFAVALVALLSLGLLGWLIPGGKAVILGLWVLFTLLVVGVLVVLEYVKQSIGFATELGAMSDSDLRRELVSVGTGHDAMAPDPSGPAEPGEPHTEFDPEPDGDPGERAERGELE